MLDLSKITPDTERRTSAAFAEQLIEACNDSRGRFYPHFAKAIRRLSGFLEDDIRDAFSLSAGSETTSSTQQESKPVAPLNMTYRNYVGWLGRILPVIRQMQAVAASIDQNDRDAAEAASKLLRQHLFEGHEEPHDEMLRALSIAYCCHSGDILIEGIKKTPYRDAYVRMVALTPFDIYYYPGIKRIEDSPAIVVLDRMTRQGIEDRWVKDDTTTKRWKEMMKTPPAAQWPQFSNLGAIETNIKESLIEVRRLFIKPCRLFPDGAQRVIINGRELFQYRKGTAEHIGSADKRYPVERLADIPIGPLTIGLSRMKLQSTLQIAADVSWTKLINYIMETPALTIFLSAGGKVTADDITNKIVAIVKNVNLQQKPVVEVMQMPQPLIEVINYARGLMEEMASQPPPSRGIPFGTRTPVGTVKSLQAAAEVPDTPFTDRIRGWVARTGRRYILEGKGVWPDKTIFEVQGKTGRYQGMAFIKEDLKEGFTVRVAPDDGLPKNKGEAWQFATMALEKGGFEDTPQGIRFRRLVRVLTDEDQVKHNDAATQCARMDYDALKEGEKLPSPLANHIVHVETERRLAAEQIAATGAPLDADFESRLVAHMSLHLGLEGARNMQMMQAQGMMPPGEGAPAQGQIPAGVPAGFPAQGG